MLNNDHKPTLVFFKWNFDGSAQLVLNFEQDFIDCLSTFFKVILISKDCDYQEICELYEPDLCLFESGRSIVPQQRYEILNTNSHPHIPKIGFLRSDPFCACRTIFLSDMEKWGVTTFISCDIGSPAYIPEIADNLFLFPFFINTEVYQDYKHIKNIPVLFTGYISSLYPWRQKIKQTVSQRYPYLLCPHLGYQEREAKYMYTGEKYARLINSSFFVPTCGTMAKFVVQKHLEIPGAKSCLVTEKTPAVELFGFKDMENCVFADETDVLDKLDYLFNNPDKLEEITQAGYDLVHTKHTIKQRDHILQWLNLNQQLKPGQKIIQIDPFKPLEIVDIASGRNIIHLQVNGLDRQLLRLGDEKLWAGQYDEAEKYYLQCFFKEYIPEPKLRLCLVNLYRGDAKKALEWIVQPLHWCLVLYKAVDPDPVEWAYYLLSLMCLGDFNTALTESQKYPALKHRELERVLWVIEILLNKNNNLPIPSDAGIKGRATIHQFPNRTFREWLEQVCIMLNNCGQKNLAKNLQSIIPDSTAKKINSPVVNIKHQESSPSFENAQKQKNNQTLTVCMMVQNSEKTLDIALSSLDNVYDELIIVDGGSKDNTCEIASKYGAKIIHSTWSGNHSQQRNVYLKEVKTDWIFVLDSDEFIDIKTIEFLKNLKINGDKINYDNFWISRKWISHHNKNFYISSSPHYPDWQRRIFKYNTSISYSGQIHENINGLRDQGQALPDLCVYHLDLLINSETQRQQKVNRYTDAEPKSGMPHYYIPNLNNLSLQQWNHHELLPETRNLLDKIPLKCKVCESDAHYFSTAKILQKYDVDYFQCSNCGFVQTEHPYWLNEAYSEAITNSDVGLVYRNNMMANIAAKLLFNYFDHEAKFLDYGGGYGLLVRLMRDQGFNFYWYDKFCKNLFATGFELTENIKSDLLLVTAFELFEHFTYPLQELEEMLKLAPNILFSTSLLPENNPQPDQWWYYTPHEGQHISIYTRKSLEVLAEKYNLKLYTDGNSLHLLTTNKNLPENLFEAVISGKLPSSEKQSLLSHDFNQVVSQILAKNSALNVNESVNITELKPPIILIDGVFFQLLKTGIARVWRSLLQEWANTEFANHILVLDRANTAPKINGIRYRTIPPYDYNNTEADKQMLQQICNEEGADLFISSHYTTPITTPSVFMAYDMIPEVMGTDLNYPVWREKHHAIKHASAYIAISQNTARDLSKYFPNIAVQSITVAHCGVSNTFSPANPLQINTFKHRYGINKPYFLLAGNLVDYKNQILFLKAFSKLPNSYEFDIIFTGFGGVFPPELRDYTSGSAVHQLRLSDEELAIAYSGAVALVYPSKYEGFGMPIVEAMACGCPVITCHNSSMPEVAGEAAIYVKENDVDAMANALTSVQNHNLRTSLITAGLAQAQKFSWTKMADKVSSALINATLLSLKLRDINLIIFPDPTQSEQSIYQDLINVITALEEHPHSDNITLLINASNFPSQFTQAFMDNLCTQDEEETAGLEISLVGKLSPMQWESLLPQLTARIVLTQEDQQTLEQLPINQLQSCEVESLNYQLSILLTESLKQNLRLRDINLIIFPEPTQSEQSIYQDLINVITALEEHPDSDNITLLINASNFPSQFTQAFMDNLCNQDEEETAGLEISLVGKLSPMQWESLLPQLSARIVLNNEDQQALEQVQLENLTSYQLDNLDNQQF